MKKALLRTLAAGVGTAIMLSAAFCVPTAAVAAGEQVNPLANSYVRLMCDKKLTIGYIGGSITYGISAQKDITDTDGTVTEGDIMLSWANRTTAWFEEKFPDAEIGHINAGVSDTATNFGVYRLEKDLMNTSGHEMPDLLFVEFTSNDWIYESTSSSSQSHADIKRQVESLVRKIYAENPYADIVFVFSARTEDSDSRKDYVSVAEHYGIQYIDMGIPMQKLMTERGAAQESTGSYYYTVDNLHPSTIGYGVYFEQISKVLEKYISNGNAYTSEKTNRLSALPEALSEGLWLNTEIMSVKDMKIVGSDYTVSGGCENTMFALSETVPSNYLITDSSLSVKGENVKISFKFKGSTLAALFYMGSSDINMDYTVDGLSRSFNVDESSFKFQRYAHTQLFVLEQRLDDCEHSVELTFNKSADGTVDVRFGGVAYASAVQSNEALEDSAEFEFGDLAGAAGDVDVDTYITAADLAQLKKILLGKAKVQSEKTADANGDGEVDIIDLVNLKKALANKEKAYFDKGITVVNGSADDKSTYIYKMNASGLQVREADIDLGTDTGNELVITHLSDFHLLGMNEQDRNDAVLSRSYENRKYFSGENSQSNLLKNAQNAMEYASFFGKTVITGDTVDFMSQGALDLFKSVVGGSGALAAVGNHEYRKVWYGDYNDNTPVSERYEQLQKNWPYNNIYYHSEILKNKVMLIVMNNGAGSDTEHYYAEKFTSCDALGNGMTGTMDKFLAADIATAKEKGYAVLIFQHCPISTGNEADKEVNAIDGKGAVVCQDFYSKYPGVENETAVDSAVYGLITENADIIKGLFCGHVHGNFYTEVSAKRTPDSEKNNTVIPQYALTCNAYDSGTAIKITVKY